MENPFYWLILACLVAAILWFCSKAVFTAYFEAKEKFVDRLVQKQKDNRNAE